MQRDDGELDEDPGPAPTADLPTAEREYLIPAKDAQGHSVPIHFRVPAQFLRMAQLVVGAQKYPFRTVSDLARFALVRVSRQLTVHAGIQTIMAQTDAIVEMLRDEDAHQTFVESFAKLQQIVERYLNQQEVSEARRLVGAVRNRINHMPRGDWHTRYEQELMKRFSRLMDGEVGGTGNGHGTGERGLTADLLAAGLGLGTDEDEGGGDGHDRR